MELASDVSDFTRRDLSLLGKIKPFLPSGANADDDARDARGLYGPCIGRPRLPQ